MGPVTTFITSTRLIKNCNRRFLCLRFFHLSTSISFLRVQFLLMILFYQLTNLFIESFQQSLAKPNKVRMCSFSSHSWATTVLHFVLRPCNKKGTASIWERLFFWYHSEEEENVGQTWSLEKKRKLNFCILLIFLLFGEFGNLVKWISTFG